MRKFDKIFDRGKRNKDDFKRNDFGNRGRDNRERPQMYDAVCDACGKRCKVPFKPSNDKPIYCSECFSERDGRDRSSNRPERRDRDFRDKKMFDAVCDKCGKRFQLPFKPTGERDVYCDDCYKGDGNASPKKEVNQFKEQFDAINNKLEKIISLLNIPVIKEEPKKEAKPKKEVKPKKEAKPKKEVKPKKEAKPKKEEVKKKK
ncbi:MAG: hypothetical protein PHU17_00230 [Candidatus Pacebacteria bacterium]|nr:hypothetical protein [Candidatus Paceibacterota bacterium]